MKQSWVLLVSTGLLAACATGSDDAMDDQAGTDRASATRNSASQPANVANTPAVLRSGDMPSDAAMMDWDTGGCSAGSIQLMSAADVKAAVGAWREAPQGVECIAAAKAQVPGATGYPAALAKAGVGGSAQVLVALERDGSVHSAEAVCATDSAFAQAAVEAAKSVAFRASTCDGKPVRSAFLLPFNYDI